MAALGFTTWDPLILLYQYAWENSPEWKMLSSYKHNDFLLAIDINKHPDMTTQNVVSYHDYRTFY